MSEIRMDGKKLYQFGVAYDGIKQGTDTYRRIIDALGIGDAGLELLLNGKSVDRPYTGITLTDAGTNYLFENPGEVMVLVRGRCGKDVDPHSLYVYACVWCWVPDGPYRAGVDPDPLPHGLACELSAVTAMLGLPARSARSLMRMARRTVQGETVVEAQL